METITATVSHLQPSQHRADGEDVEVLEDPDDTKHTQCTQRYNDADACIVSHHMLTVATHTALPGALREGVEHAELIQVCNLAMLSCRVHKCAHYVNVYIQGGDGGPGLHRPSNPAPSHWCDGAFIQSKSYQIEGAVTFPNVQSLPPSALHECPY